MTAVQSRGELPALFNGTVVDEREVLAVCLDHLYIGSRQVVRALTRSGMHLPADEERARSYMRENLEGLSEETLADFLPRTANSTLSSRISTRKNA
jgi:hypothetical protein